MPDSTPATLKHQRDPIHPLREALCGERYGWRTSNPGEVTCFACRRHVNFNTEWGVETPTPPVKLSGVMAGHPQIISLTEQLHTHKLHRINDVLTALAHEMGVRVTIEWEDEVLNDLTHHVAEQFGITAP